MRFVGTRRQMPSLLIIFLFTLCACVYLCSPLCWSKSANEP